MNWEHGSELVLPASLAGERCRDPWAEAGRYYGSGRDALRDLLRHGRRQHGWQRLRVPYYFCQHVAESAARELPVVGYFDSPELNAPADRELDVETGDVVLVPNYFGHRTARWRLSVEKAWIVEDHTHDPWSEWATASSADYAIASLRKTLPLPDGGVLWSPRQLPLPTQPSPTPERTLASLQKFQAQILKSLYLQGAAVAKETFRQLATQGEANLAGGQVSGMPAGTRSLLDALPTHSWRARRACNHSFLKEQLSELGWRVLPVEEGGVPLSLIVVLSTSEQRATLQAELVRRRIYPSVLWPLDKPRVGDIPGVARSFASRMLCLACDARYDEAHLHRLVDELAASWTSLG